MSQNKKIVITGGAGFIGSQLGFEMNERGYEVVLLDNLSFGHLDNLVVNGRLFGSLVARDIRDADLRRVFDGADAVVHLAGLASLPVCQCSPQFAYDVNTSGTANVLEQVRLGGVRRFIMASTSAVYEQSAGTHFSEDAAIAPNLIYAMTKAAAEQICRGFVDNHRLDVIIARFFNVYGPHQDFKRSSPPFTSYVARELIAGRPPMLFNRSDARRDYVHSADMIRLLVKMVESPRTYAADVYNIGSGQGHSVPELFGTMARILGSKVQPEFRDPEEYWNSYKVLFAGDKPLSRERVKKEVYKTCIANIEKTTREFDWRTEIDIERGLSSVLDYARAHGAA